MRNKKVQAPDDQFYLDFAILFSLPTRGAGDGVPDDLQGIQAAGIDVIVVLLLLELEQPGASPLPFSRHGSLHAPPPLLPSCSMMNGNLLRACDTLELMYPDVFSSW